MDQAQELLAEVDFEAALLDFREADPLAAYCAADEEVGPAEHDAAPAVYGDDLVPRRVLWLLVSIESAEFGPWFVFPIIGLVVMLVVLVAVFGPRGPFAHFAARGSWGEHPARGGSGGESALDILKRRYASGEITREQFEQMRRDIL